MKAEIISVGSELLLGHTVNSDAAILARELASLGFDLVNAQIVGDNPGRLREALELAASRSDIIVTSGGLGPTDDDLTKNAVADFAGVELVENAEATRDIKAYFGERAMSANQARQAYFPKGAKIFQNMIGTAPGCAVAIGETKHIIMLPGPPAELEAMLVNSVRPWLSRLSTCVIHSTILRTFGIGEGAAAEILSDLMAGANPTVAPYAHGGEMFVKVTAKAANIASALAICAPVAEEIKSRLGDVVYGQDVDSLEQVVVHELVKCGKIIATAESCTGGLLAKRITDQPGASAIFQLGLITYANKAKERLLNVPEAMLADYGAVSPQVARAMAENMRTLAGSDFAIGITGIAGPDGGNDKKPLGLVYIALASSDGCKVAEMRPAGKYLGREWVRERASGIALDMIRRSLAGLPIRSVIM